MNRRPWFWSSFDGPYLISEFLQSNPSHLWKKHKGWGGLQMWEVGFWLHWQLWGTEVSQSRKWLDLPCGRLAHPDNNPHSFEHPGSPQAPTEGGGGAKAVRQRRLNLLLQAAKNRNRNLEGPLSPLHNKTEAVTRLLKGYIDIYLYWIFSNFQISKSRCELHHYS